MGSGFKSQGVHEIPVPSHEDRDSFVWLSRWARLQKKLDLALRCRPPPTPADSGRGSNLLKAMLARLLLVTWVALWLLSGGTPASATGSEFGYTGVVRSGGDFACGVKVSGSFVCWGSFASPPTGLDNAKSIEASWHSVCAVTSANLLRCWTNDVPNTNKVPTAYLNVPVKFATISNSGTACAVFSGDTIVCWDLNSWFWPTLEKPWPKSIVGMAGNCILSNDEQVECFQVSGKVSLAIASANHVAKLVSDFSRVCALDNMSILSCFSSSLGVDPGVVRSTSDIADAVGGFGDICSVAVAANQWVCGRNQNILTGAVQRLIPVSSWFGNYPCAFIDNQFVCPDQDVQPPHLGPDISLPQVPLQYVLNSETGEIHLFFDFVYKESYGPVKWQIFNKNGQEVCRFDFSTSKSQHIWDCIDKPNQGGNYFWRLVGSNSVPSSSESSTPQIDYCPANPSISLGMQPQSVVLGKSASVRGSVSNLCSSVTFVEIRQKLFGKNWGNWIKVRVSGGGTFSQSYVIKDASQFEARVLDKSGTLTAQASVNLRLKAATPFSISSTGTKTPQGFLQGGKVLVNFRGDSEYSGTCSIAADTETAFNFAGTYMGAEHRISFFKVKNGKGSGGLTTRWSGKFTVIALCSNPRYEDVVGLRFALFKVKF